MSATISRAFIFSALRDYEIPDNVEANWRPRPLPLAPETGLPALVKNRWIYAFQIHGQGPPDLYQEIFAGSDGKLQVTLGTAARTTARTMRPVPVSTGTAECTLPHTISGRRVFYYFFVSRIRLHPEIINALETQRPKLLTVVDVEKDAAFEVHAPTTETKSFFLRVLDPIAVALELHRKYEEACNEVLAWTTGFAEMSEGAKARLRSRGKALVLAELLAGVIKSDPQDKLGLKNELLKDPLQHVGDHKAQLNHLLNERDEAGEVLCFFIDNDLFENILEMSYRIEEETDYHLWIDVFSRVLGRLSESQNGRARLGRLMRDNNHVLRDYVHVTSPPLEKQFQVARKVVDAVINLWKETAPVLLRKHEPAIAVRLAKSLDLMSRETGLLIPGTKTSTYSYRKKNGRTRTVTKTIPSMVPGPNAATQVARWFEGGKATKAMEQLFMGIEAVNLCLALSEVSTKIDEETLEGKDLLNLVGSAVDVIVAFQPLLKLANRTAKLVGALSAVLDIFAAGLDGFDAYSRDDKSSAVGFGIVAAGSALIMAGSLCAVLGLGVGTTVVGLPLALVLEVVGAILVGAGWAIAIFTEDSDIEQFVSHCRFGISHKADSKDKPTWATAAFNEWSKDEAGLDHQIGSLLNLLAAFTLKARDFSQVRITTGLLAADSRLVIQFSVQHVVGKNKTRMHRPLVAVDIAGKTMTQLGGDPADLSSNRVTVMEIAGRTVVDVEALFPPAQDPSLQIEFAQCSVFFDLHGDGRARVPASGQVVPYNINTGFRINHFSVSSKDIKEP